MNPRIIDVKAINDSVLRLKFSNGEIKKYDCSHLFDFGIFQELKDPAYFRQVRALDGTAVWPHEQDICPDTLYLDSN
jgi:hypothetical protein